MPDNATLSSLIHWYHGVIALGGLLTVFGVIHRLWIAPIQAWRKGVDDRINEIEKEQALQEQRLESGDKRFEELVADIKAIREAIEGLRVALAGSVFKGVGLPD